MVEAGMPAIEVFHPDHDASDIARYQEFAARFGLLVTGGSDYHGPGTGRAASLGRLGISEEAFAALADPRPRQTAVTSERRPLIAMTGIQKHFGEPQPLVIRDLTIRASDRVALPDLNTGAAEILINLITGASLPEEGTVRVDGHDTRDIKTGY